MKRPLDILMVSDLSPSHLGGGGERVLWEQASGLAQRGHRVRILARAAGADAPRTLERHGVRIRHVFVDRRSDLRFLRGSIVHARRAAAEELEKANVDVLHVHQPLSGYGVLRSPAARAVPALYTFLSPAPLEFRSRRGMTRFHRAGPAGLLAAAVLWAIERACLRRARRIHVLSDYSLGQLRRLYRIPENRVAKIPGGADVTRFCPAADRAAVRTALSLPAEGPVLLTVRNLEARMGLDILIRAVAALRRDVPDVLLLIGGAGSLRGALESLIGSLGLEGHVRFLGFIPNGALPAYYQAADAFVLPTRELEGFGLVTVEALACGTPVLGTPVGATPEILGPLDASLLFPEATAEAMAESLRRFLVGSARDAGAARCFREACRRHALAHYTWDRSLDGLETLLWDLASSGAPGATAT